MPSATQSHSPGSATTELSHSITTSSSVSSNTNSTIPGPTKPCESKPCGGDASCVNLYSTYICLCTEGYYFNSGACLRGKTFPGLITVKGNDVSDLQNGGSLAYENFWNDTTTFFQSAFAKTDYKQTVIHTISTSSLQARFVSVMAKVVNIFEQNTTENETSVSAKINDTITNSNNILAYSGENRCDYYGCKDDPQDNCLSGSNCQCKDGLQRPFLQSPFCLETFQCPKDCNPENKKQCLKDSTGRVVCKCLPGYRKTDGDDACQECPFGYSGMNCEDKFQLILTIVGAVLGVLVLGLLIALVISVSSSNKKNIEEQNLIENDFQNLHLQHTAFSNPKTKGSLFPEVRTQPSRAHQGFNPYGDQ
ncbi:mucin-13 [Cavia porcellus]|uniref:mucin-13 n=1 Tax=Cavia porcellus TaxID=10141 RepID=UPI000661FAD8|nr:mucin-13 [Cavia porcellus]